MKQSRHSVDGRPRSSSSNYWALSMLLLVVMLQVQATEASPVSVAPKPAQLELRKRTVGSKWTVSDVERYMTTEASKLESRYGTPSTRKRAQVTIPLENAYGDSYYYTTVQVGTPPKDFDLIVDTGSADAWLASDPCTGCASNTPLYDAAQSSTANVSATPFSITYGSGSARGTLTRDTFSLGGLTVEKQVFAQATYSANILSGSVSGLLGGAFSTISSSQSPTLISNLIANKMLDQNIISFALTRWTNVSSSYDETNPGGIMTLGGTNSSLYSGQINWVPLSAQPSYFVIALDAMSLNGASLGVTAQYVAVDTGTSLIGVPYSVMTILENAIPGSQTASLQGQSGYLTFPCNTTISVAFTFGGIQYPINPTDFNAGFSDNTGDRCYSAFFGMQTSGGPEFIVGDSFLKNVYTAFRYSPDPAVGFAQLSRTAVELSPLSNGEGNTAADVQVSSTGTNTSTAATSSTPSSSRSNTGIVLFPSTHGLIATLLSVAGAMTLFA